jgi:hypothetical protein
MHNGMNQDPFRSIQFIDDAIVTEDDFAHLDRISLGDLSPDLRKFFQPFDSRDDSLDELSAT